MTVPVAAGFAIALIGIAETVACLRMRLGPQRRAAGMAWGAAITSMTGGATAMAAIGPGTALIIALIGQLLFIRSLAGLRSRELAGDR